MAPLGCTRGVSGSRCRARVSIYSRGAAGRHTIAPVHLKLSQSWHSQTVAAAAQTCAREGRGSEQEQSDRSSRRVESARHPRGVQGVRGNLTPHNKDSCFVVGLGVGFLFFKAGEWVVRSVAGRERCLPTSGSG